jgi:hypothetical protein
VVRGKFGSFRDFFRSAGHAAFGSAGISAGGLALFCSRGMESARPRSWSAGENGSFLNFLRLSEGRVGPRLPAMSSGADSAARVRFKDGIGFLDLYCHGVVRGNFSFSPKWFIISEK